MKIPSILLLAVFISLSQIHAQENPHSSLIDRTQSTISHMVVNPIAWFDRFFMSPYERAETNRSYLRLIGDLTWINGEGVRFSPRVQLKARLPGLQHRLSLIVSGEEEPSSGLLAPAEPTEPNSVLNPKPVTTEDEVHRSVALRFQAWDWVQSRIDLDVALKSELRTEVSARYRWAYSFTPKILSRLVLKGFWLDRTGFGTNTRFEIDRPLFPWMLVGWNNSVTQIAKESGFTWTSIVHLDVQLSPKSGLVNSVGIFGPTSPSTRIESVRVGSIYRRNFFREWLFWELEPWIERTRHERLVWENIQGSSLRLEVQFRDLKKI